MLVKTVLHFVVRIAAVAAAASSGTIGSFASDRITDGGFADVADRVRESVVTVATAVVDKNRITPRRKKTARRDEGKSGDGDTPEQADDFMPDLPKPKPGEPERQYTSVGSGVVIDRAGYIVTNNHVIEGGNEIYVIFNDGEYLKVDKVLGRDLKTDLCLLKVTAPAGRMLKAAAFGDSARMRVGDWVLAIGNPFGLGGTVTAGILSGTGRDINAGPYDEFLQTDAAINKGNSGGPLFNIDGEVIGINTAIFSPTGGSIGLGFAIPSNTANRVAGQLQRYGETQWGSIGVRIQSVNDDIALNLGLTKAQGALVARVDRGGPADVAGVAEGDVILAFAGSSIRNSRQLPRLVAAASVGDQVELQILRSGERKTLKVKVALLNGRPAIPPLPAVSAGRAKRQKADLSAGGLRGVPLQITHVLPK